MVVIVDLGSLGGGVRTDVIEFGSTVDGIEALQLAGASPVTLDYGALGQAVCSLHGVGDARRSRPVSRRLAVLRVVGGVGA